jgi:hypothetical protein
MLGFEIDNISELCYAKHKVIYGRPTMQDLPQDIRTVFEQNTRLDREIYDFGVELFRKKVNSLKSKLNMDVEEFQEAQRKFGEKCEADTIMGKFNACVYY